MKHPLAVAEHAVNAPMNEHAEFGVLKFLARLQILRAGCVGGLRCGIASEEQREA